MKKFRINLLAILSLLVITACNQDVNEDFDTVAEIDDEAGLVVSVSQSSGGLLGSPETGVDIEDAEVEISDAFLNYTVTIVSGSLEGIEKLEVVKYYNGDINATQEVYVSETTTLPYTLSIASLDDFLSGTGVAQEDLRIGDSFTFRLRAVQTDGDVYYFNNAMARMMLTLNCSYDLTGTYSMENSVCGNAGGTMPNVQISQNPDGTWLIADHADGGLLDFCSTNNIINPGSIAVGCGGVVSTDNTAGGPDYCEGGGYGIGCITGGSWDQETGILSLTHSDAFFPWSGGSYTSTYTRL